MTPTPTESQEAILPCPFCGGAARLHREADQDGFGTFLNVVCRCGARTGQTYYSQGNDCPLIYQEARDRWNTRHNDENMLRHLLRAANARGEWLPIEGAPVSTPTEQDWFFAYCPNDPWALMGNVHIACRYAHEDAGMVKVTGSNAARPATHWRPRFTTPESN